MEQLPAGAKGLCSRSQPAEHKSRCEASEGRTGGTDLDLLGLQARKALASRVLALAGAYWLKWV